MTAIRKGFFSPGEGQTRQGSLSVIRQPGCAACGLYKDCQSPKMPVSGSGNKRILIIGEAPGATEDEQGKPFVGKSGELLQKALRRAGVGLFQDCWVTNSLRCRPKGNKLPKDPSKLIEHCRPLMLQAIKEYRPEVIILLGGVAVQSLIGWLWKEDVGGIMRWVGWRIPSMRLNAWVCPTLHPSFILRGQTGRGPDVAETLFQTHLDAACALQGRPYDPQPPELDRCVRRLHNPDDAAHEIYRFIDAGEAVAYDYETDRLKPDHSERRIVCCSVSNGRISIAFPWHGAAREAMRELLFSRIPKVGWNMKFEERWTRREFGRGVRNWILDGMLAAHTVDSRKNTKSLKFQAFARLGAESYDDHIKPYLAAGGGNDKNRITEVSLDRVLSYCALDSLLAFRLGEILAPQVGVEL